MADRRLARVKQIFLEAVDLDEGGRERVLSAGCTDDPNLRASVEELLAEHDRGLGGFLEPPTRSSTLTTSRDTVSITRIGPYRIIQSVGEGGMGEVFEAEQEKPVRRRVALKLIKRGLETEQVLARFEAERQALALMDHPCVAKVFDAGESEMGRPYFAMEYVQGIPITEHCDRHRMTTRERLTLFIQVCEGIQHAHQKAVIHRDIKPSNVLVAIQGEKAVPKIIDFGVAKAMAQPLTERTLFTEMGQLIGTPSYMSPEQAEMTGQNIDTRTDVYSLGAMLYELLVGAPPFDSRQLRRAGLDGIRKTIREVEPPKPSARVTSMGEDSTTSARNRRTAPKTLSGQLRGELDWITMKALEKDRGRRYVTANELAKDIERHLADHPVVAGPPSPLYVAQKYFKRHRIGVAFFATVFVSLVLGFIQVTVQNSRIVAARNDLVLVTNSLEEMLASVDPTRSGRDVTVRELLDESAKTLGMKYRNQPLVEASLRHTVGKTYEGLGDYVAAEAHLERAVEIQRGMLGEEDPETLESMAALGWVYRLRGRYQEAEALLGETLAIRRRVLGEEEPQTLSSASALGSVYRSQGRYEEAEGLQKQVLEIRRRVLGEEDPQTLSSAKELGLVYSREGRYDEAEALELQILEIQRRVLGEEHPSTLDTMSELASTYTDQKRYEEAVTLIEKTLEIQRRVLGEEHPQTTWNMRNLAFANWAQGRYEEAETLERKTLEIQRRVLGEDHPYTNSTRYNLACWAARQDRRSEAIQYLRDAVDHGLSKIGGTPLEELLANPALVPLRGDPAFEAIVEELRRRNEEQEVGALAK